MKTSTLFLLTLMLISRPTIMIADERYAGEPFQWGTVSGGVLGAPAIGPVTWNVVARMKSTTDVRFEIETELNPSSDVFSLQTKLNGVFEAENENLLPTTIPNVWRSPSSESLGISAGDIELSYRDENGILHEASTTGSGAISHEKFFIEVDFSQFPEKQGFKFIHRPSPTSLLFSRPTIEIAPGVFWSGFAIRELEPIAFELIHTPPGDTNSDGSVSFVDFLILSTNFDPSGAEMARWKDGDFNDDRKVDFDDFLVLSNNFGKSATNVAAVPEPSSSLVMIVGVSVLSARRRRRPR